MIMKTKWMIIPVIAMTFGCTREIDTNVTYINGEFTLYATSGDNETRTVLQEDGRVFWKPEDCITVFYGNVPGKFTSTNTEPAASAEFTGSLGSFVLDGETEFKAIYPYSDIIVTPTDEGILSLYLPSEQTAVEGTFADDLFICVAKSKDYNLHFYNVCGGVSFSLARDDIKKVVFRGNNKETLAGTMFVDFAADGIPQVIDFTAGRSSVTLSAPEGETLKQGVWYYLVTAPQTLSLGYTMELWTDEIVETITSESPVTIRRSAWGVLNDLGTSSTMDVEGAVDLGLPSGLLWATCNLGAANPEESGDYFAWGETEPYYMHGYALSDNPVWKEGKDKGYDGQSYKWGDESLLKYCTSSYYGYKGYTDGLSILEPEDDASTALLGSDWRTPSIDEWGLLIKYCDWKRVTYNGMDGYLVTGPNSNCIFIPAVGRRTGVDLAFYGRDAYYWSSSLDVDIPLFARYLFMYDLNMMVQTWYRNVGLPIRPVYGKPVPVEDVTINIIELDLQVNQVCSLVATVSPEYATNQSLFWTSSNNAIAKVSPSGEITCLRPGSVVISATTVEGGITASCNVTVSEPLSPFVIPECVDLGLPSGILWSSFNLGARKPEDFGVYYAWGEVEPKSDYEWNNYKWSVNSEKSLTKYCSNTNYGYNGFTDGIIQLEPEDDAAHAAFGDKWRMPTSDEFAELREKCSWEWISLHGVNGYKITGPNGNCIFIPASGKTGGISDFSDANKRGCYNSSNIDTEYPYLSIGLDFDSDEISDGVSGRCSGRPIRPVYGDPFVHVKSISLDKTDIKIFVDEMVKLTATISPSDATVQTVSWSSSDESIATVTSDGVVKGISLGSALITITAVDGEIKAICDVTVIESPPPMDVLEAIDLGLSSGLKWASLNLGATRLNEPGDYYAWGETEPYYSSLDPLTWKPGKEAGYDLPSYRWSVESDRKMIKYCTDSSFGYDGFTDGKFILDPEDDAAHVHLGDKWRIPTDAEWTELREKCSWEWTSVNGADGYMVTGPNGNSIFLPAAGISQMTRFFYIGSNGYYWSSSLDLTLQWCAWYVNFDSAGVFRYSQYRSDGHSIRPVYDDM
ncbi:MAG: Ig-like domain-containing protein [Bacteroidales bacterium]|nr:Ig-like domain-containing protein [Bacteroidales bacterium]